MRKLIISFLLLAGLGAVVVSALADDVQIKADAPNRYIVKKGDTLWGISKQFLKDPWRWSEIWNLNRTEIKDPHWIYPGDIIMMEWHDGKPQLVRVTGVSLAADGTSDGSANDGADSNLIRVSPTIRSTLLTDQAIPAIPSSVIEPYLTHPLIVAKDELEDAPLVVESPTGRVASAAGDEVYAKGMAKASAGSIWNVYRLGRPVMDPNPKNTDPLAYEAEYAGSVRVTQPGKVTTLSILTAQEEVEFGDRLVVAPQQELSNYVPHPAVGITGQIASVYGGKVSAGQFSLVVINRGKSKGVELGQVFGIETAGHAIDKAKSIDGDNVTPTRQIGHGIVFRVFDKVAYVLVTDVSQEVLAGDVVTEPR